MPRVVDPAAQREAVLRATWRTIAAHGLAGATVRRIAEEAGVSTGFIHHWFQGKHEVVASALALSNQQSAERLAARAGSLRGLAALRAVIEAVLPLDEERRLEWLIWVSFWGEAGANPELAREWRAGRDAWHEILERRLREAQADGEILPDLDPGHEADRLAVLIAGIGLHEGARRFRNKALLLVDEHLQTLVKAQA